MDLVNHNFYFGWSSSFNIKILSNKLKMINLKLIHGFQVWIIKEAGLIQHLYAIKIQGGKK